MKQCLTVRGKLWCNASNQTQGWLEYDLRSDLVLCVFEDRRAGRRKRRKREKEKKENDWEDRDRKVIEKIGKDKRQ